MGVAVTFQDDNAAVEVKPGAQAACTVRVVNTGSVVDGILLDVLGDAGEWASVEPPEVNLLPGASASAKIVFSPPRAAELSPGEVPFGLRAMSREDPDGSRIEEGVVRVGEFSELDVSLVPKSSTGRRSAKYKLIVENRGNRFEKLSVEALDPDVKLAFKSRPGEFEAPPGTATFVRLTASPRKTFFKGPNRSLPFDVTARPEEGTPVKAAGVMLEKQILPEWLLPMLGLAVVAAGLLIALWLTVLRPIVHSAATAAADAGKAATSAKSAAKSAKSAGAATPAPSSPASPAALTVSVANPTILTKTTELATVTGSFHSGIGALPNLVWTSSNPKIAKVSQNGVVTGMGTGAATITATGTSEANSPSPTPSPSPSASNVLAAEHSTTGHPAAGRSSVVSGSVSINVVGKVRVTSKALAEAAIGKPYSTTIGAGGGTGSFTWSISGGSLPPGLSLSPSSGSVTGTPTMLGKSTFTIHLADAGPPTQFTTKVLTVRVVKPLAVDTSSLPGGTVGGSYQQPLAAIGGTPPYKWSISPGTGALPAGLRLNAATGMISGTPTSAGAANFTIQVADAAAPGQTSTETLSVNVVNPLALSTLTLPTAILDTQYQQSLTAFGGIGPYSWSVSSGTLPAGLTLSPVSGSITGTPTTDGSSTFTIQVGDSDHPGLSVSRTYTVDVVNGFGVTTSSLTSGKVGQPYTAQLSAAGGVTPYVWTLQGTLPAGLSLSPGGTITGTATSTGSFPFTVQAVDSSSPPLSVTASLTITIVSPLKFTATSLPEAVTGVAYSRAIGAVGGAAPYTFSISSGSLPQGLTLAPDTGAITGTAVNTGTSTFTISVTDSDTPTTHVASLSTSITVVEPLVFTEPKLVDAVLGVQYAPVTPNHVSGGSGAYQWSITSGVLPSGMTLDAKSGTIAGTPNSGALLGNQNFTLTIADANDPSITTSEQETIRVEAPLEVETPEIDVVAGNNFSQDLSADVSGGLAPYTFSMPSVDGLSVDPNTGVISGLPDAPCPGGGSLEEISGTAIEVTCPTTSVGTTLRVTDSNGSSVTIEVAVNLSVAPMVLDPVSSLPDIADGDNYSQNTLLNGALPSGGYGPTVGGLGGFSFSTSRVSVTGTSGTTANNNGLPCNQVGCSGLIGRAQLTIDPSSGVISGKLGDLVETTTWTFRVTITDTDPQNSANNITISFQLSISVD